MRRILVTRISPKQYQVEIAGNPAFVLNVNNARAMRQTIAGCLPRKNTKPKPAAYKGVWVRWLSGNNYLLTLPGHRGRKVGASECELYRLSQRLAVRMYGTRRPTKDQPIIPFEREVREHHAEEVQEETGGAIKAPQD